MFISKEEIKAATGKDISATTLSIAQLMIEAWVGRDESEVEDAGDAAILGKAVLFQAVYINSSEDDILEQAAVKQMISGDATVTFDERMFAPYMSPWAIKTVEKLSWKGTRSIHTGAVLQGRRGSWVDRWVRD